VMKEEGRINGKEEERCVLGKRKVSRRGEC